MCLGTVCKPDLHAVYVIKPCTQWVMVWMFKTNTYHRIHTYTQGTAYYYHNAAKRNGHKHVCTNRRQDQCFYNYMYDMRATMHLRYHTFNSHSVAASYLKLTVSCVVDLTMRMLATTHAVTDGCGNGRRTERITVEEADSSMQPSFTGNMLASSPTSTV